MTTQEALDIKMALITLSKALGDNFNKVASLCCFYDDRKQKILLEASRLWNEFDDADLVTRGSMLGITITTNDETEGVSNA